MVDGFYRMLWQSAKCPRLSGGRENFHERRFGEPLQGPTIPFEAMVEYHPISKKDQSRLHQFGRKVLPGIFLGYASIADRIWNGDILIADMEDMGKMLASEIHPRRDNAEEVLISKK